MRQKDKPPSDNLCSAVLDKMRLLNPCNIKHAYGIITSKLPFLFLFFLIIFFKEKCSWKAWKLLIEMVFAN